VTLAVKDTVGFSFMAYVPGCQDDVFISYAHAGDPEWILAFERSLSNELEEILSRARSVWFDVHRLRGGDPVTIEIQSRLDRTAILLAILSPPYLESTYCMVDELEYFLGRNGWVLPVLKVPLRDDQPSPLDPKFYIKIFSEPDGPSYQPGEGPFHSTVQRIARDVRFRLEEIRKARQRIYISRGLRDETLRRWREELYTEFHTTGQGYAVEPGFEVTPQFSDAQIRAAIEACAISIHIFNGEREEQARRQFDIARAVGKPIVVCGVSPVADLLPIFMTGDWRGDVISEVEKHLKPRYLASNDKGRRSIYLIYQRGKDEELASDSRRWIAGQGEFDLLEQQGGVADHEANLKLCDAVLLCSRFSEPEWISQQELAIGRALLRRAAHPFQYLAGVPTEATLRRFLDSSGGG
jgi:hypothetical protein